MTEYLLAIMLLWQVRRWHSMDDPDLPLRPGEKGETGGGGGTDDDHLHRRCL